MSEEHSITRHRTLVEVEQVEPADGIPPFFEETGNGEIQDYSDDSGGEWFECQCGEEFTSADKAHDHVLNQGGGDGRG